MFCHFQEPCRSDFHIHLHCLAEVTQQVVNESSFQLWAPEGSFTRIHAFQACRVLKRTRFLFWFSHEPTVCPIQAWIPHLLLYSTYSPFYHLKLSIIQSFSIFQQGVSRGWKVHCCYLAELHLNPTITLDWHNKRDFQNVFRCVKTWLDTQWDL